MPGVVSCDTAVRQRAEPTCRKRYTWDLGRGLNSVLRGESTPLELSGRSVQPARGRKDDREEEGLPHRLRLAQRRQHRRSLEGRFATRRGGPYTSTLRKPSEHASSHGLVQCIHALSRMLGVWEPSQGLGGLPQPRRYATRKL